MNDVKKMVLVEPRVLESMKANEVKKPPLAKAMSELDAEMNDILTRSDLSTSDKVKLYEQTLQRYVVFRDKMRNEPTKVTLAEKKRYDENAIYSDLTKTQMQKARDLVSFIKNNASLGWNEDGEFVYDGQAIANSNIKDLVSVSIGKSKQAQLPGWTVFQASLDSLKPQSTSKRKKRIKWEAYH